MRIIYWLLTTPLLIFIISFATSNRDDISLYLLPLPFEITMPLAFVGLSFMLLGAVIGMVIIWTSSIKMRMKLQIANMEINNLNNKITALSIKLTTAENITKDNPSIDKVANNPQKIIADNNQ